MNNNKIDGFVIGGIVVVVAIIGLVVYSMQGPADTLVTPSSEQSDGYATDVYNTTITNSTTTVSTTNEAPTVETLGASDITASVATLRGTVTSNGLATAYWFEYSADPDLGAVLKKTTTRSTLVGSTEQIGAVANVIGLSTNTKYYYRIVAQNTSGLMKGSIASFNTK